MKSCKYEAFVHFCQTDMTFKPSNNKNKLIKFVLSSIRANLPAGNTAHWYLYKNDNAFIDGSVFKSIDCKFTYTRSLVSW